VHGNWFDGTAFETKTFYSVAGILHLHYSGQVDSTIDLQNKFIIPPFFDMLARQSNFPGFTATAMHNQAYFVMDNEQDLNAQWPRIKAGKPDFVKIYLKHSEEYEIRKSDARFYGQRGLDPQLLPKIVALAHRNHLRVTAHVNTARDFHNAVMAGVDEIAHLPLEKIDEDDAERAARQNVVVVTTTLSHRPTGHIDRLDDIHRYNLRRLDSCGVKLALGTDNNDLTVVDEAVNLHRLKIFDDIKLLKLWIENTPQTIFPERKIGFLQEGYEASFLAVEGNPLENFANISKISFRFKQGQMIRLRETQRSISGALRPVIAMAGVDEAIAKYHQLKTE
jgi:hypothetical protein